MPGKEPHTPPTDSPADHEAARCEAEARQILLEAGAADLDRRPWLPSPAPLSATDLTQFALWRAADLNSDELLSALALLPAAKAEVSGVESGLLFIARSAGLTWAEIANAMGFRSPQACQQYVKRLNTRQHGEP